MRRIHLCTGILIRAGMLLMVASRYPNHPEPLWNLPGGRQEHGELLSEALAREFLEETGLSIAQRRLAYVSESHDRATSTHFLNVSFEVDADGEPAVPGHDAHAVACAWVPVGEVAQRLVAAVVREPLRAYLAGDRHRYYGYGEAGITIEFND